MERKNLWTKRKFLLCVHNEGYEASLEIRKLYEKLPDKEAERHDQVRIIDESGEDYLYPSTFFAPVRLSIFARSKLHEIAA
jgi:hypothetical protein